MIALVTRDIRQEAQEALDDALILCAKIVDDRETRGRVAMDDLTELRDAINTLRGLVAGGAGYSAVPSVIRPGEDE